MNPENCPRCGAESNKLEEPSWECGSFHSLTTHFEYHTDLCTESETRQKAEAENAKLRKLLEVAIEVAEDALEERDLKRRIADEIRSLKAELNRLPKS
jgi:predicted ATP-dependent serine protease